MRDLNTPAPDSERRDEIIRALTGRLGAEKVLTAEEDRICYAFDASKDHQLPSIAVLIKSTEDVVRVTEVAREFQVPIVARGAGSGMTGGAIPTPDGIVLVFTQMNEIREIDRRNLTATVEPGVVIADLNLALGEHGLWYPPDPASAKIATLGGSVAESAGGLRGVKWGTTRDYILRLEVVTMRGEVLRLGARTHKSVTGYDLVRQIVGSEGTLAIITEIMVKVVPKPEAVETLVATFDDEIRGFEAAAAVIAEPIRVSALEAMDAKAVVACRLASGHPLLTEARGLIVVECDGHPLEARQQIEAAERICRRAGAVEVTRPVDEEERERLWEIRRGLSTAVFLMKPKKISEDICVPQSRMAEAVRRIREIEARHEILIINFGHAGDGNFHVNCMFDPEEEGIADRVNGAIGDIFQLAMELGGTLSGEHGIGTTKRAFLPLEVGEAEMALMRRVKAAWDPEGLLNPGKIFPA
jgi:glycolate oxidase